MFCTKSVSQREEEQEAASWETGEDDLDKIYSAPSRQDHQNPVPQICRECQSFELALLRQVGVAAGGGTGGGSARDGRSLPGGDARFRRGGARPAAAKFRCGNAGWTGRPPILGAGGERNLLGSSFLTPFSTRKVQDAGARHKSRGDANRSHGSLVLAKASA